MSIQAIDQTSVHRLTSGQVVIDLQTAVKELLENALDAGATSIEVRFKEYGVDSIEVQDNGRGIEESDWSAIALKHHTSKLTSFADLTSVTTLGFRGEALSSLCGTAKLSLTTSTATTSPAGTSLTFEPSGVCVVGGKVARSKGTTVIVKELFHSLPVRRKALAKNAKKEFAKAVELVQSYALIRVGCRIEVKNFVSGKATTHLQTPAALTLRLNFSSLFTPKSLGTMMDLDLSLDVVADKSVLKYSEGAELIPTRVTVKGLVSKPTTGSGRPTGNRQFYYVNGRPFFPTRLAKAFNEVYKSFNTGSFPCVVADFQLPTDSYDVNVSPDKRTIFLHSEGNLIAALKTALEEAFQPSRSTYPMDQIGAPKTPATASRTTSKRSVDDAVEEEEGTKEEDDVQVPAKRKRGLSIASEDIDKSDTDLIDLNEDDDDDTPEKTEDRNLDAEDGIGMPDRTSSPIPGFPSLRSTPSASQKELADSPSPPSSPAPPAKLRQLTLETQGTFWALELAGTAVSKKLEMGREKEEGKSRKKGLKEMRRGLKQFLNPGQKGKERMEVDEEVDEVDEVEEEEEAAVEMEEDEVIEEDEEDMVVVENGAADGDLELSDDEIVIVPSQAKMADEDDLIIEDPPQVQEEADEMDLERTAHLAFLDSATRIPPTSTSEIIGVQQATDTILSFSFDSIASVWSTSHSPIASSSNLSPATTVAPLNGASVDQETGEAEATLSRVVSKEDFESMQVIGQFNLGFIIARRTVKGKGKEGEEGGGQDDLFIVDQHASDEIYNFEKLQAETIIQSQRLLQPRTLNLPSHDEITAMEHLDMLRMNGFEVVVDEEAPLGERVKLAAQPVSKGTEFGVADLEELLELIQGGAQGEVVRPSKARKMFASRACRKSVMIGTALNLNQMTTVVRHMGVMDQPWACPHGRPTMRWLAGLGAVQKRDERFDLAKVLSSYS